MEIENKANKSKLLRRNFNNRLFTVTMEYKTKGILNAIEAAVIFLFPATPLRLIALNKFELS